MDSDESFDDDCMGTQALHVESDDNDLDLDIPPTTGNEYLRRVRMEASICPTVVVADINTQNFKSKQTVHVRQWVSDHQPAPSGFAPSLTWQNMQVAKFVEQRQKLVRYKAKRKLLKVTKLPTVPPASDAQAWCLLCFGRIKPPPRGTDTLPGTTTTSAPTPSTVTIDQICDEETQDLPETTFPKYEGILPLVSTMVAMDQPTVMKVLEYHLNWLEVTGFSERQGYWFYALLVCLDKPLSPEACSLIRDLARACSRLRATLTSADDPKLTPLNLFICLISRYFDQSDLKDDVT